MAYQIINKKKLLTKLPYSKQILLSRKEKSKKKKIKIKKKKAMSLGQIAQYLNKTVSIRSKN